MGLGSTAKKLQQIADMAEDVYTRLNQLREQVTETRAMVVETRDEVAALDRELAEQRALIEALAEDAEIDVESVTASVHVVDAEEVADGDGDGDADGRADPEAATSEDEESDAS